MTAQALLDRLERGGVKLKADGNTLLVSPRGILTPEARSLLIAHKAEIIALLQKPDAAPMEMLLTTARMRLFSYLDLWAEMNGQAWIEANVRALHDDLMDVFEEHPGEADCWLREWRTQHPEVRRT